MNQPPRTPKEGPISVTREGETLVISCTHDGVDTFVVLGMHNAFRALALLIAMLEWPVPVKYLKGIVL